MRRHHHLSSVGRALADAGDLLLAALALPVLLPLWLLPWKASVAVARLYGFVAFVTWGRARRAGMINLRRAYGPGVTRAAARRDIATVFAGMAQSLAEGIQFVRRHRSGDSWRDLVEVEDAALAGGLLSDPRPKIFVTGHLGSWEIAMQVLERSSTNPGAAVVRRVDNRFLQALVLKIRVRDPGQWIEKAGAVPVALARLKAGTSVAFLLDENGGRRGPFVPFFGRPASTRKTPALLSALTGAPVVVGAAVRRPGAVRPFLFRLAVVPSPEGRRAGPDDVLEMTRRIVAIWERWVREDPLQWRWIHWRWRTRPDGTEESYGPRDLAEALTAPESGGAEEATP